MFKDKFFCKLSMDYKLFLKNVKCEKSKVDDNYLSVENVNEDLVYVRPRLKFGKGKTRPEVSNMMDEIDTINRIEPKITLTTNNYVPTNQNTETRYDGWVYCLSNQSYKGIYKIGFTTRTPKKRADELSRETSILYPFVVEVSKKVKNCRLKESQLHKILNDNRVRSNKEFFDVSLEKIKTLFDLMD